MRVETKWAIIPIAVIMLWMLLAQALGLFTAERFGTARLVGAALSMLTYAVSYYMVTKEKRDKDYNGVMSWSEGFWAAARMTLIYIPISSLLLYIYIVFINPAYQALVASGDFGKDPVNVFLFDNVYASFIFGGAFCLLFPLFTRRGIQQKTWHKS